MSTNGNGQAQTTKKSSILDAPLEAAEMKTTPPGVYPARLAGMSEPFDVPVSEQFRKPGRVSMLSGREDRQAKMNLIFAVKMRDGSIGRVSQLVSAPDGKLWNTSNLWGTLETLAGGDAALWNGEHGLAKGATLRGFLMRPCQVDVENKASKKNPKQVFAQVKNLIGPVEGLTYPTEDEALSVLAVEHDDDTAADTQVIT